MWSCFDLYCRWKLSNALNIWERPLRNRWSQLIWSLCGIKVVLCKYTGHSLWVVLLKDLMRVVIPHLRNIHMRIQVDTPSWRPQFRVSTIPYLRWVKTQDARMRKIPRTESHDAEGLAGRGINLSFFFFFLNELWLCVVVLNDLFANIWGCVILLDGVK